MKVKFEDVFHPDRGVEVMTKLMEWLNIALLKPIDRKTVTERVNVTKGGVDLWDEKCTAITNKFCRSLMSELGY
jgi:hypothetical protein